MAPEGANLLANASIPLPALVFAPVTALFGATVSYDLLSNLAIGFSAWTAYLAIRRLTRHRASAFLGGTVYGFSGYMAGQALAHGALLVAVLPPIALLLVDDIRQGRRPLLKAGILGLACAAQLLIHEELLASTLLFSLLVGVLFAWRLRPTLATAAQFVRPVAVGLGLFLVLGVPLVAYQLLGPEHVHGAVMPSGRYVNDLLSFVSPNRLTVLHTSGSAIHTDAFSGFDGEYGGYLGLPLICLLVWTVVRLRRRVVIPATVVGVAALCSLGPRLWVDGHETGIPLPWEVPYHLPLLNDIVPDRLNVFIWLGAAVMVALFVDDLRSRPLAMRGWLAWALVAVSLVVVVPLPTPSAQLVTPSLKAAVSRASGRTPTVLIVPLIEGQLAMYAQLRDGFSYSIPEGGLYVPGVNQPALGMRDAPLLYALTALEGKRSTMAGRTRLDRRCLPQVERAEPLSPACRTLYVAALRKLQVSDVAVIDFGSPRVVEANVRFFRHLLGHPKRIRGATLFVR
jgi:hypothetical protein